MFNPVQLRRVTTQLVDLKMIDTIRGKDGGYLANDQSADVSARLYKHFGLRERTPHTSIYWLDERQSLSNCSYRNYHVTLSAD